MKEGSARRIHMNLKIGLIIVMTLILVGLLFISAMA
jgi:hypothetical protein